MKMKAIFVMLLLTVSIFVPILAASTVHAVDVPPSADNPPYIYWQPGGIAAAGDLAWNPEFLKLETETDVHSDTRIIIQGRDTYGQNIEAKVDIPAGTSKSEYFMFNDTHTTPPMPVAFAYIDRIFQQNGTESTIIKILTEPWLDGIQLFLGYFDYKDVFLSGTIPSSPWFGAKYLIATGLHDPTHNYHPLATTQAFPVEPMNPEKLKVAINWKDSDKDLQIDDNEFPTSGAQNPGTFWLEGLDEHGNKIIKSVSFVKGDKIVEVPHTNVWSTVCKAWTDSQEEFYVFTHPLPETELFKYGIFIDHLTIHPDAYDILANPESQYGKTRIIVALRDVDGNLVHAHDDVILNFYTSAGKIQPSNDISIKLCHVTAETWLFADTNARTLKVVVDANVPPDETFPPFLRPAMNLRAWIELTFDGINSVLFTGGWPIHTLMCGYNNTASGDAGISMPAPFLQWLPPELGGPQPDGIKLDGPLYEVMIPLYVGCNLISSPVYPMFGTKHYDLGLGIPMELLFGMTSATDTIEAIWWYDAGLKKWNHYIPALDGTQPQGKYFTDGVGYWIKAEKPCTLELSGVAMENAPFVPAEYPVYHSWNLMGFTSVVPMNTEDYLESLATGPGTYPSGSIASAVGPIWTYNAAARVWIRNPDMLWPTNAFWMNYKLQNGDLAP
jgi:hypothetical protein